MKQINRVVLAGVLGAVLAINTASAQPAHAPAHGARGHHHHDEQHHRGSRHSRNERSQQQVDLPRLNERELLRILRQYNAPASESLPPGLQRQIERGKPLPPGIAKRFDDSLTAQLPRYPGYEWERVGTDVVLVEAATRVVIDILVDALRY
ncbi:anti-virulence regulator CigR family protein [Vreelandella populi]|uniref:anti-virulence regulator CigR family protein n=1 Tax=Vreelandella populi TaxID=2498858 RepID=UPI000F8D8EDF|nr:anti-virulence regulator CigR family protein [Halomonas populi]RUR51487.1 hypothetical protein ELY40_16965 [Halomonas populi]